MLRPLFRAAIAAFLLVAIAAPAALAHAELESASPGPDDRVTGSPAELVARFSQDLDASRSSLEVRDVSGRRVVRGGELGSGPREFRLNLPELEPGMYEVRWASFSKEDGELARGSYTFTVVAAPSPTPTATLAPSATPSPTATPVTPAPSPGGSATPGGGDTSGASGGSLVVPILASLLVIVGFGTWMFRRRPR